MIAVLGSTGQLGSAFVKRISSGWFPRRDVVDLRRLDATALRDDLVARKCQAVINCAAFTAVDAAEAREELATIVNGNAVGTLAEICDEVGIPFVTYSTDYVFDGSATSPYVESSRPNPLNAYGRSKLEGERRCLGVGRSLVVRTSWVISGTHPNFVGTMLDLAARRRRITVVNDQVGRPTTVDDLAGATLRCLRGEVTGLLHLTNTGPNTTWFEMAETVFRLGRLKADLAPCTTDEYPTDAARPAYSVLGTEMSGDHALTSMPSWPESLEKVVREQMELVRST